MVDKGKIKDWKQFLHDERNDFNTNIINRIEKFPKKLKFNKTHTFYDDGLETAISNSEITYFYEDYFRKNFKKYVKSIPFPFEKLTPENVERFNKLNQIANIFKDDSNVSLQVVSYICLHLMGVILYDMYFDIKSRPLDVYEKVDELIVPDENNELECKRFGLNFSNKENPLNYIVFYSNTDETIMAIRNYN